MYVIFCPDTGKYLSCPYRTKNNSSYSAYLQEARVFTNSIAAEAHRCGNEEVISVTALLNPNVNDSCRS